MLLSITTGPALHLPQRHVADARAYRPSAMLGHHDGVSVVSRIFSGRCQRAATGAYSTSNPAWSSVRAFPPSLLRLCAKSAVLGHLRAQMNASARSAVQRDAAIADIRLRLVTRWVGHTRRPRQRAAGRYRAPPSDRQSASGVAISQLGKARPFCVP